MSIKTMGTRVPFLAGQHPRSTEHQPLRWPPSSLLAFISELNGVTLPPSSGCAPLYVITHQNADYLAICLVAGVASTSDACCKYALV